MKLKDFVASVLTEIEQGVNTAAVANNRYTYVQTFGTNGNEGVEFDVAVTASSEASGRLGAEVFQVGAKTEGKISNQEVSRIKFRVSQGSYFKS